MILIKINKILIFKIKLKQFLSQINCILIIKFNNSYKINDFNSKMLNLTQNVSKMIQKLVNDYKPLLKILTSLTAIRFPFFKLIQLYTLPNDPVPINSPFCQIICPFSFVFSFISLF